MRVLIVEDDAAIAEGLDYYLTCEGFSAVHCGNVSQAMEMVKKEDFDLCLLDLSLPDGSGFEICNYIKKNKNAPVIFLSASDDELNVVRGLDMGADDYITKPFRVRELISRIKTALRHYNKKSGDETITVMDITVNLNQAKVFKGDNEVLLTTGEYRLLLELLNNRGKVLSRTNLLESLWDIDSKFINDNTLSVYIKRLREKLEDDSAEPKLIETVRGLGYRIGGANDKK